MRVVVLGCCINRNAGLQQLPPILYQVLLLSGTAPGMRSYALRLIISLFDILEPQQGRSSSNGQAPSAEDRQQEEQQEQQQQGAALPSATLMQVQATLLMHVSTMLRYDVALGSEWLKWATSDAGATSTNYFLLQVCTLATLPRTLIIYMSSSCHTMSRSKHIYLAGWHAMRRVGAPFDELASLQCTAHSSAQRVQVYCRAPLRLT